MKSQPIKSHAVMLFNNRYFAKTDFFLMMLSLATNMTWGGGSREVTKNSLPHKVLL